jgi:hypothetical protein
MYRILWNLKLYHRVQKSLALVPAMSHISPVHTHESYFFEDLFY